MNLRTVRLMIGNALLAALWGWFGLRFLTALLADWHVRDAFFFVLESLFAVMFLVRRAPKTQSSDPGEWFVALAGSCVPFLMAPVTGGSAPVGIAVQCIGVGISVMGLISLNRSFGIVPANRGTRTGGMYRFVRHPIYAGHLVAQLGFVIAALSVRNAAVLAASFVFLLMRIVFEEDLLKKDHEYSAYASRTPWRLLPFIY